MDAYESRTSLDDLLDRMRSGDRDAAAEFALLYARMIRLRLRGRIAQSLRRVFDSEDLVSTVARRLDGLVAKGQIRATTERQLWSLVGGIALRAICEHARSLGPPMPGDGAALIDNNAEHMRNGSCEDMPYHSTTIHIDDVLHVLSDDVDRVVLLMRLRGATHGQISAAVGLSSAAVRMRWHRVRRSIRLVAPNGV